MIQANAPGKVVLWGEYAVLAGAPALVMAVDRRATCEIEPGGDTWRFTSRGFAAPDAELDLDVLLADRPPENAAARVTWQVLREFAQPNDRSRLPAGARVVTDTGQFYRHGEKLGIGSSAAICTAVYAACCKLVGRSPDFDQALTIHNDLQDKRGSGIDVAAAFYGGTLRYRSNAAVPYEMAPNLYWRFLWTGLAAKTTRHIARFDAWRARAQLAPLTALASTCEALFERASLATFARYTEQLQALDAAARLGIYSPAHRQLNRLAIDAEVVYKPCGAGGGDVGAAISDDEARLDRFAAAAANIGITMIPLEKARHGVQLAR